MENGDQLLKDCEALKHHIYLYDALKLITKTQSEKSEMNTLKRIWQALNTDITPALKDLKNQLQAIYDPQLVPVTVGDMTIEWVDRRTGERPWL